MDTAVRPHQSNYAVHVAGARVKADKSLPCEFESMSLVTFALPFDTSCLHCGTAYARGSQFFATKGVAAVSQHSGLVTWRYSIPCARCSADLEFCSYLGQDEYKSAGSALKIDLRRGPINTPNSRRNEPFTRCASSKPRGQQRIGTGQGAAVISSPSHSRSSKGAGRILNGSAAELHALQRQRDADYSNTANTAYFLEKAHKQKWNNTPLRMKSREVVEEARRLRSDSRLSQARLKSSSVASRPLMKQQSRTGRMERLTFKSARRAVKKLSNSGALGHIRKCLTDYDAETSSFSVL
jgi:hypothetical protein